MGQDLIVSRAEKTAEDMIDHEYINILEKSIIDDETWESLENRHLIKYDKHKNT